jgi:hypothetical protein
MTYVRTSASVWFGTDGPPEVDARLHLTGSTRMNCYLYAPAAPILAIDDAHVKVTLTVPESDKVTGQDVTVARELAEAVARYVAELERLASVSGQPGSGTGSDDTAGRAA